MDDTRFCKLSKVGFYLPTCTVPACFVDITRLGWWLQVLCLFLVVDDEDDDDVDDNDANDANNDDGEDDAPIIC